MLSWGQLKEDRPDLTEGGRALLYQYGVGLGFLATVRPDGGPRVHPMCPMVTESGLYALIIPSPKRTDLLRDGRYALHSFAAEANEDAFYITGRAVEVHDSALREELEGQYRLERPDLELADLSQQGLFEFLIETALLTRTTGHGDPNPKHEIWHAPPAG